MDLTKTPIDPAAIKAVPEHIAKRYNILPIKRDSTVTPNRLMVAIGDVKTGAVGLDDVKLVSRCKITSVLATKSDIEEAIIRAYSGNLAAPASRRTGPLNGNGRGNGISDVPGDYQRCERADAGDYPRRRRRRRDWTIAPERGADRSRPERNGGHDAERPQRPARRDQGRDMAELGGRGG